MFSNVASVRVRILSFFVVSELLYVLFSPFVVHWYLVCILMITLVLCWC